MLAALVGGGALKSKLVLSWTYSASSSRARDAGVQQAGGPGGVPKPMGPPEVDQRARVVADIEAPDQLGEGLVQSP